MKAPGLITLTTDFGTADWFVGTLKGVIAGLNPGVRVVDLTHEIPPGDIRAGAFALMAGCRYFPRGTIHVVVVDPGVGSARRALVVQTADYFFLGPDNGVLAWALAKEKVKGIRALENAAYFLHPVSRTFHGRDVFAPVAAHVSRGVPLRKLGPGLRDFERLAWPQPRRTRGALTGEVVYIDRFGNVITNLEAAALSQPRPAHLRVCFKRKGSCPVADCYQAVRPGEAVGVIGSSGCLEIAVRDGDAARTLRLRVGDAIVLRPRGTRWVASD